MSVLVQPPFDTSLMGVVQGALNHYQVGIQSTESFTCSGHAFFINIHDEICPSGPYCWDHTPFLELLGNLGLVARLVGKFDPKEPGTGAEIDTEVANTVSGGTVCSALSMEHQLIVDVNQSQYQLARPWGEMDVTPPCITRGSWAEVHNGAPLKFFAFDRCELAPVEHRRRSALEFGVQAWRDGQHLEVGPGYGVGQRAYPKWLSGLEDGFGESHGNWWNTMVWSECRRQAADYFKEWAQESTADSLLLLELAEKYGELARLIDQAGDRTRTAEQKIESVTCAQYLDEECVSGLEQVLQRR